MPHSLRVKIKGLRYKGIITYKDCERLCKALDNEDVLEQIRAEIASHIGGCGFLNDGLDLALEIIDKHMGDTE